MVKLEMLYFNGRGRCELLRYILHAADIPFDDRRISFGDWPKIKRSISTGKVPVLYVDGEELNEFHAIARYLADAGGLAGTSTFQKAKIDSVVCQLRSFIDDCKEFNDWMFAAPEHDNITKENMEKMNAAFIPYKLNVVPILHQTLTRLLIDNGSTGFLVGDQLTWADLNAAEILDRILAMDLTSLSQYDSVARLHKNVHSLPRLQKYLTKEQPVFRW